MQNDLIVCGRCGCEFTASSDARRFVCPVCGAIVVLDDKFKAGAGVGVAGIVTRVCAEIFTPACFSVFTGYHLYRSIPAGITAVNGIPERFRAILAIPQALQRAV